MSGGEEAGFAPKTSGRNIPAAARQRRVSTSMRRFYFIIGFLIARYAFGRRILKVRLVEGLRQGF